MGNPFPLPNQLTGKWWPLILVLFFIAIQVPFLQSDPDILFTDGRGANTDEGLNTCQIRNFVNHGVLTLDKSDNLIKTPFFSLLLCLPFKLFGTSLLVARLTVLLFVSVVFYFLLAKKNIQPASGFIFLSIITGFYLFHYSHYSLAEMVSTGWIVAGLSLFIRCLQKEKGVKNVVLAATAISFAWLTKIQFVYVVAIIPLALVVFMLFKKVAFKRGLRLLTYASGTTLLWFLLFYIVWYYPNNHFFDDVMQNQTADRFAIPADMLARSRFNFGLFFHSPLLIGFSLLFYTSFFTGIFLMLQRTRFQYSLWFVLLCIWIGIELHKLPMIYLPGRYLISLLFAMGMLIFITGHELVQTLVTGNAGNILKRAVMALVVVNTGINAYQYYRSFHTRTFAIKEINQYLSSYEYGNRPVIGAWAPSLTWDTKALTYPVWNHYFNDSAILVVHHPRVIVSETDEADSEQAYSSNGIDLVSVADSVRIIKVNHWELKVYWLP